MKDIAIYNEKTSKGDLSNIITVFTFSQEARDAVAKISLDNDIECISMKPGNKPESFRIKIKISKDEFNRLLSNV